VTEDYPPQPILLPLGETVNKVLPLPSGERIEVRGKAQFHYLQLVTCNMHHATVICKLIKRIYYEKSAAFLI
jgi:hypothetical protein